MLASSRLLSSIVNDRSATGQAPVPRFATIADTPSTTTQRRSRSGRVVSSRVVLRPTAVAMDAGRDVGVSAEPRPARRT